LEQLGLRDIPIFAYGFMMMLGFLSAITLATHLGKREGLPANQIYDLSFLAIVSGIVGSRIMWVIQESSPHSIRSFSDYFAVWQGGLVYYGGLILALFTGALYVRWKKLPLGTTLDCFAPGLAAGLGFGRLGCLLNGCCYGATTAGETWYSLIFPPLSPAAVHHHGFDATETLLALPVYPAQPLSSLAGFTIMVLLLLIYKRRRFHGQIMLHFLQLYAVARFTIEFVRADTELYWQSGAFPGLHPGQIVAIVTFFGAGIALRILKRSVPHYSHKEA
jgi:phosphatidylglycerol:prolipoprotein diacylglycerol transferase